MSKRKGVSESDEALSKKLKPSSNNNTSSTKLSFDSAEQCLLSLIYPTTMQTFLDKNWEKEPLFIQRNSSDYYGELWTKANLEAIAKKTKLVYEEDVFVLRYSKENINEAIEAEGKVTMKSLQKYLKDEKATIMLAKPHRFCEKLHSLQKLLESYFGCCAYVSLRVTAEGSQGYVPGYTRGEEFILQVEGKSCWCLYKPVQELAIDDSDDLEESEIGDVVHEFELQPGDLLYFPRGTVFQATCLAGHHSTHLSIQLYIENHWGRFLSLIFNKAIADATKNDISFRQGLPVNFLSYMSYGKKQFIDKQPVPNGDSSNPSEKGKAVVPKVDKSDVDKQMSFHEKLHKICDSLLQHLDPHWGADYLGRQFMSERLPPFTKTYSKDATSDKTPDDNSLVQMTYPDHVRVVFHEPGEEFDEDDFNEDDEEEEEEEEEDEKTKKKDKDDKTKSDAKKKTEKESRKTKSKTKDQKKEKKDENEDEDEDEDEDEEMEEGDCSVALDKTWSDEQCIVIHHSLQNGLDEDILDKEPGHLKFPVHYRDALLILHRSTRPVAVKDLPLINKERVELAMSLWSEGLLEVKETS